ncbi:hypothetical protein COP1_013998 [Malus domestica]
MGTTPITMQLALGDGGDGDLSNVCHAGKCFSSETPSTLSTSSPQTPTISTSRPAFSFPTRLAHILIQNDHPKLLTLFFTPNYNPTTSTPSSSPSNPTPLPPSASLIGPAAPLACTTTRSPSAPSFTCCSATGCSLRGFVLDIVASNKSLERLCKENQIGGDGDFFTLLLRVGPKPNVVTFSTMINMYCKDGKLEEANKFYKAGRLEEGLRLFAAAFDSRIKLDVVIFSSVMDAYVRIGDLAKSVKVYRRMLKEGISPNSVSYTILINGMCHDDKVVEARGIFGQILKCGFVPSVLTYGSLIDGMCRIGNVKDAFQLYERMIKTGYETDIIVYCVLLNGLCKNGLMVDALKFFFQAVYRGVKPNVYTFNMLIDGCCRLKRLRDAVKVYMLIIDSNM